MMEPWLTPTNRAETRYPAGFWLFIVLLLIVAGLLTWWSYSMFPPSRDGTVVWRSYDAVRDEWVLSVDADEGGEYAIAVDHDVAAGCSIGARFENLRCLP